MVLEPGPCSTVSLVLAPTCMSEERRAKLMLERIPPNSRQKLYLILVFASLNLLFLGIWQTGPVIVQPDAPLGLASYLPALYWIGLALIVLVSVLAFLDREVERDAVFITILIALGLFLYGIRVFLYECAQDTDSY